MLSTPGSVTEGDGQNEHLGVPAVSAAAAALAQPPLPHPPWKKEQALLKTPQDPRWNAAALDARPRPLSSPRPSQSATYGEGRSLHATGPEVAAWTETALSTSVPCGHNPHQAPVRLEEGASVPGARTATCEGDSYFEDCCVFFSLSLRVA